MQEEWKMHDLQQLAEAAMLQQSREGDGDETRANPRRLAAAVHANNANAGSTLSTGSSANDAGNSSSDAARPRRLTRQRSARTSAASAGAFPSVAPLPPASFARSPPPPSIAATGSGSHGGGTNGTESSTVRQPNGSSAPDGANLGTEDFTSSSAAHPRRTTAAPNGYGIPSAPPPAKAIRRRDKKHSAKKESVSSVNTVKSALSATSSSATSVPPLSYTSTRATTDPSVSSAASDISSRTSDGTHATTPEHVSTSDAVHVLYATGGQPDYPSCPQSNLPYPVYHHHENVAAIANGKTGPTYHHIPPPPPSTHEQAILAGNGDHQDQSAYVNLHGRSFDPSQVQLYPHVEYEESRSGSRRGLPVSSSSTDGASNGGIQLFIDPYALPANHPYHPSQTHSHHSATPQPHQQPGGGLNYGPSATIQPRTAHDSGRYQQQQQQQQQQHYVSNIPLPPLPSSAPGGPDYSLQYSNATHSQSQEQASSGGYSGYAAGAEHPNRRGLDGSAPTAAHASIPTSASLDDAPTNTLREGKSEVEQEDATPPSVAVSASASTSGVPAKKQKGRRPTNSNLESKNHKCKFENCNWSFSRREHLRRHEKTHTQDKPFLCDIPLCGLRFSRLDNLNSHKRTHEKGKRTTQWHSAKVVGAQQAARAGSGSVLGEGSEDGRGSVEASSILRSAGSADRSGIEDPSASDSAGGTGSNAGRHHYAMPGSATLQQNGFPRAPPLDTGNGTDGNNTSTVGAEVRFAYYDPPQQQPPHSASGVHQQPQQSIVGLGGPYGNVRGYQDPFSYSAPPPPPPIHGMPMAHHHAHPSQQQQQLHHHHHQQQHSYHQQQPLPPLPPSMHDESAYMHQHQVPQQQPQQHHLTPHLQPSGVMNSIPQHPEFDHRVYNTEMHSHQLAQHHLMRHQDQQRSQQQQAHPHLLPPPPPPSSAAITTGAVSRTSGSGKRKRNEGHRSTNSSSKSNANLSAVNENHSIVQHMPNQSESPSHKRRQSGRKGVINT